MGASAIRPFAAACSAAARRVPVGLRSSSATLPASNAGPAKSRSGSSVRITRGSTGALFCVSAASDSGSGASTMTASGIGATRPSSAIVAAAPMQSISGTPSSRDTTRSRQAADAESSATRKTSLAIASAAQPRTLAERDRGVDPLAAAHQAHPNALADAIASKCSVHIVHVVQRLAGKLDQNIADQQSGLFGRSLRSQRENDQAIAVVEAELAAQGFGQRDRAHPNTEIAVRDASTGQQLFDDAAHRRCRDRDAEVACERGGTDSDDLSVCIGDRTAAE